MTLTTKLLAASGGVSQLFAEDCFACHTYTGNGSTQTITNGIDLAGKGGMVWSKRRDTGTEPPGYANHHTIFDTARTLDKALGTNDTYAEYTGSIFSSFNSNGYTLSGTSNPNNTSPSAGSYVSWTFRKSAKFFDVVTYTGNATNRTISHSLGQAPGMIAVKRTDVAGSWMVYHRSLANTDNLVLNTTAASATNATAWNSTTATSSVFSLGTHADVNTNAATYVAYLFAHDTSAEGLIQCGSFTSDAGGVFPAVTLGWEPQYVLVKASGAVSDWEVYDASRGFTASGNIAKLRANLSSAETANTGGMTPTATGFSGGNFGLVNTAFIYAAIRRPNKPPTVGTQVYNAIARTGTGAAATVTGVGFAPDAVMVAERTRAVQAKTSLFDRLRGAKTAVWTNETTAEDTTLTTSVTEYGMDGVAVGASSFVNTSAATYINHFFKRAPGVLDQICFTGTGANKTEAHNLTVAPELWLVKGRSGATQWVWGSTLLAATEKIVMPTPAGKVTDTTAWNSTYPTASVLSLGTAAAVNTSAATYTAYLWATKAGISKVFSYTGNGSSQNIDCGFTTGARFVMIVRTDTGGDFFLWDIVRGIIAGNDPHLSLNTTAAEVTTDDSIDSDTSGFIVNQLAATNINVSAGTYIGISFS